MAWSPFSTALLVEDAPACGEGFAPFFDNEGNLLECISILSGQKCIQEDDDGTHHSGAYNDRGACVRTDKSHIRSTEEARLFCQSYYGDEAEGYLKPDGSFGGCCSKGLRHDPVDGGCVCPDGEVWDEAVDHCVADTGGGETGPGPSVGNEPDCVAEYGPNHYPAWSDDAETWGCFPCRPDERGQEDGYCYCKPGTVRADPNDPSSACIVRSGSSGGVIPGGSGQPGSSDSPGGSGASGEKKSIWPWVLGGVALAALGTAVYLNRPMDGDAGERADDEGIPSPVGA